MELKTRVFEFYSSKYANLFELAQAVGTSVSQLYRVRGGKRPINEQFIIGAIKAFPGYKLDDLFYVAVDEETAVAAEIRQEEAAPEEKPPFREAVLALYMKDASFRKRVLSHLVSKLH